MLACLPEILERNLHPFFSGMEFNSLFFLHPDLSKKGPKLIKSSKQQQQSSII